MSKPSSKAKKPTNSHIAIAIVGSPTAISCPENPASNKPRRPLTWRGAWGPSSTHLYQFNLQENLEGWHQWVRSTATGACEEGAEIGHSQRCTAFCAAGYVPSVSSLECYEAWRCESAASCWDPRNPNWWVVLSIFYCP